MLCLEAREAGGVQASGQEFREADFSRSRGSLRVWLSPVRARAVLLGQADPSPFPGAVGWPPGTSSRRTTIYLTPARHPVDAVWSLVNSGPGTILRSLPAWVLQCQAGATGLKFSARLAQLSKSLYRPE